jgi:hypothetical protein
MSKYHTEPILVPVTLAKARVHKNECLPLSFEKKPAYFLDPAVKAAGRRFE